MPWKRMLDDRQDWLLTLGLVLTAAGFVVIGLGWFGAARRNDLPQQFPYLLSGGIAGLGLLLVGSVLILTQSFRRDHDRLHAELAELRTLLSKQENVLEEVVPHLGNGHFVLAGRSSFHDPECHLASGRDGGDLLPVAEAADRGLEPCRVCKPLRTAG